MHVYRSKDVDSSLPVKLLSIARDVAAGLDYLAGCNFIHRVSRLLKYQCLCVASDPYCWIS